MSAQAPATIMLHHQLFKLIKYNHKKLKHHKMLKLNNHKHQHQTPQVTATPTESKASEGSSVNVNDHLKHIAQRESGGNIHAVNPTSGAAGKYQFLQSTWDSVAPLNIKVYHQQMLLKVFKMPQ